MKLSACDQTRGKIVAVQKSQTATRGRIDIGGGVIIISSITNEAVDDLGIAVDEAMAMVRASDVMVAK